MYQLHKHPATNPDFQKNKEKFSTDLSEFHDYAEMLTFQAGKVTKRSNKAGSYCNYLVRYTLLYKEIFNEEITTLNSFATLEKLKKIKDIPEFKTFNSNTSNFFSATYSCFEKFLYYKQSKIDESIDLETEIQTISHSETEELTIEKNITSIPKPRQKKIFNSAIGGTYPRNFYESLEAKNKSNWTCELDPTHKTFISSTNNKPFVEAHHLVPMYTQDFFENSLDFAGNIISLCPNCHRLVHLSEKTIKEKALKNLYNQRKKLLKEFGIETTYAELLKYYDII
ncbi:hypothetical protein P7I26_15390 [Enterococcus casseliflavus]|uniref:HNH endonuclease n=1 Tax=Enterococcus casseliflavus TaxID=37734 RepID=UPI002890577D|nr:HNH endonuclease [Enterococcus casseliflavus]MDT2987617.1 hypothetical protein [Enterococcus casseliflavus]